MVLVDPHKDQIFDEKLIPLYKQYNSWGKVCGLWIPKMVKRMNMECVGQLNKLIREDKISHFVMLNQVSISLFGNSGKGNAQW